MGQNFRLCQLAGPVAFGSCSHATWFHRCLLCYCKTFGCMKLFFTHIPTFRFSIAMQQDIKCFECTRNQVCRRLLLVTLFSEAVTGEELKLVQLIVSLHGCILQQVHSIHKTISSKGLIQLWHVGQLNVDSARWSLFFSFLFTSFEVRMYRIWSIYWM